jgi:hypothetical protein
VPLENRVYWTKRLDGLAILQPDQQLAINRVELSRYPGLLHGIMARSCYQMAALGPAATMLAPSAASRLLAAASPHPAALAVVSSVGMSPTSSAAILVGPATANPSIISTDLGSSGWRGDMGPPPPSSSAASPLLLTSLDGVSAGLPPASQDNDNDSGALDLSSGSREREGMKSRSSVLSHISAASHHSSYMSGLCQSRCFSNCRVKKVYTGTGVSYRYRYQYRYRFCTKSKLLL